MKCLVAAFCLTMGLSLGAQTAASKPAIVDEDDYSAAMKEIAARNAALRKSLSTPSGTDAAAAASRLEAIFKNIQVYWEHKKVEDATALARKAVQAAQDIAKSLEVHDIQAATASSQALAGTCMSCHDAHRARLTDGFYKIK